MLLGVSNLTTLSVGVESWLSVDQGRQFWSDLWAAVREAFDEVLIGSIAVNGEDFEVAFFLVGDVADDLLEGWPN